MEEKMLSIVDFFNTKEELAKYIEHSFKEEGSIYFEHGFPQPIFMVDNKVETIQGINEKGLITRSSDTIAFNKLSFSQLHRISYICNDYLLYCIHEA